MTTEENIQSILQSFFSGYRDDLIDSATKSILDIIEDIEELPSAEQEPHYCRECKWSWCHINVGKHGEIETYWRCLNWDGETDEEGFCHEWERRTDE